MSQPSRLSNWNETRSVVTNTNVVRKPHLYTSDFVPATISGVLAIKSLASVALLAAIALISTFDGLATTPTCPPGAVASGLSISLSILTTNSAGLTNVPVGGQMISSTTFLWVTATLGYIPSNGQGDVVCGFSDGQVLISTEAPNTPFSMDVTPAVGIPLVGPTGHPSDCPGAVPATATKITAYGVPSADDIAAGSITFFANYTKGTAWISPGQSNSLSASVPNIVKIKPPSLSLILKLILGEQALIKWHLASAAYYGPPGSTGMFSGLVLQSLTLSSPMQTADLQWVTLGHPPQITNGDFVLSADILPGASTIYRLMGPAFYRPTITTSNATLVTDTTVTMNGSVMANDDDTAVWFQYGMDTTYGLTTVSNVISGSDTNQEPISISVGGLFAGTGYHFRMVGTNSGGTNFGDDFTFTTSNSVASSPPVAVTLAATSVTSNSVVLNGTVNPEGSPAYGWFFFYDINFTGLTDPVYMGSGTNSNNLSQAVHNLIPATTYYFETVGSNANGTVYGGYLSFTTSPVFSQPPPAVQTLAANSVTTSSAVLNGTVNANGDSTTLAYYQYGLDTTNVSNTPPSSVPTAQGFPFTLSGLNSSTTYYYRMAATNTGGISYGQFTNFTTAWAPLPPSPLSPGTPTDTTNTLANLTPVFSWIGTNQASSYDLSISQYPYGNANIVATFSVGGSSYQLPSGVLQNGTKYAWYMTSFNSLLDESAPSGSLYFQTPAQPDAVTLVATNITSTNALLTASVNPNGLATAVYFQYGRTTTYTNTTGTNIITGVAPLTVLIPTMNNLTPKFTWHFRVVAGNALGTANGLDMSFMPP